MYYRVMRQDDHGNTAIIEACGEDFNRAKDVYKRMTRVAHKQMYWIEYRKGVAEEWQVLPEHEARA